MDFPAIPVFFSPSILYKLFFFFFTLYFLSMWFYPISKHKYFCALLDMGMRNNCPIIYIYKPIL